MHEVKVMKLKFLIILCISLIATSAKATLISGYTYSHEPDSWYTAGSHATGGFRFKTNQDLYLSALGFIDVRDPGLNAAHEVGIWDNTGNLIASTTVAAGEVAPLIGGFRYSQIPALSLLAGEIYTIAAISFGDVMLSNPTRIGASEITLLDPDRNVYAPSASAVGLTFPDRLGGPESAIANFLFSVSPPSPDITSAPEPNSLAIILLGFGVFGLLKQRNKTQ